MNMLICRLVYRVRKVKVRVRVRVRALKATRVCARGEGRELGLGLELG